MLAMKRKTFSGAGRKPRAGVERHECGKIVRAARQPVETQEQVLATAVAQPHRKASDDPREAKLGYALGRALLTKTITGPQFMAGERYTVVAIRYMRDVTGSLPRFPSMAAELVDKGVSGHEQDPDAIQAVRNDWDEAQRALLDTGEHYEANRVLAKLCVMDRDLASAAEVGVLRVALNALVRLWKIEA